MKLLGSTDFALRVLMRLAAAPDSHISTEALARELAISRNHLQKIVQYLVANGLVTTIRGARGGVRLARPAAEIDVGAVVRSHERDQALVACFSSEGAAACTLFPLCRLRAMLEAAKEAFYRELERHTLAECFVAPGAPPRPARPPAGKRAGPV